MESTKPDCPAFHRPAPVQSSPAGHARLYLFNAGLDDLELLKRDVPAGATVRCLAAQERAIAAIGASLVAHAPVDELVLVGHGAPGLVALGAGDWRLSGGWSAPAGWDACPGTLAQRVSVDATGAQFDRGPITSRSPTSSSTTAARAFWGSGAGRQ